MIWSANNRDLAGTQAAMVRATRKALQEAKLRGQNVPQWRDGKVIWVQPDEIDLTATHNDGPAQTNS